MTVLRVPLPCQVMQEIRHPVTIDEVNIAFSVLRTLWGEGDSKIHFYAELQIIFYVEEQSMMVGISYLIMPNKSPHTKWNDMLIGVSK